MDWLAMIFVAVFNITATILKPVFEFLFKNGGKTVTPVKDDILLMSATALAEKIRKKELKCEKVIQSYVRRVREVNPLINAVVQDRFEAALEDARAIDGYISETDLTEEELKEQKPLLGVPLTVKESCSVKGMKLTLGSLYRIDEIAKEDGDPIAKLKEAGAIPILVSNTPEYLTCWHTNNLVTGLTRNPYNSSRSAAGSSGGEGALLGAGASVIGVGSDLGGSIRLPSAFNGIFGHKPSRGLISIENHYPLQKSNDANNMQNVGPMVRYAEDLPIMVKVMSGDVKNAHKLMEPVDLSTIDVYYMESATDSLCQIGVQREIKAAVIRAVAHLRNNCKSRISSTKFPGLSQQHSIVAGSLLTYEKDNADIDSGIKNPKEFSFLSELVKILIGNSMYSFSLWFFQIFSRIQVCLYKHKATEYKQLAENLRVNLLSKLGSNGVFIYPVFPMTAFVHNYFPFGALSFGYTMIFNILGFPSTSVPMGLDSNGVPVAVQVIAAPNQDRLCLAVAKELSNVSGWIPPS